MTIIKNVSQSIDQKLIKVSYKTYNVTRSMYIMPYKYQNLHFTTLIDVHLLVVFCCYHYYYYTEISMCSTIKTYTNTCESPNMLRFFFWLIPVFAKINNVGVILFCILHMKGAGRAISKFLHDLHSSPPEISSYPLLGGACGR